MKKCWKERINPNNGKKYYTMHHPPFEDQNEILALTQDSHELDRWWYASDIFDVGDFNANSLYDAMRFCEEMYYDYLYDKEKYWERLTDEWESTIYCQED